MSNVLFLTAIIASILVTTGYLLIGTGMAISAWLNGDIDTRREFADTAIVLPIILILIAILARDVATQTPQEVTES